MNDEHNQNQNNGQDPLEHLYAYRSPERQYHKSRFPIRYVLLGVLLLFVVVVWVAYPRGAERFEDVNLPLIRADKTPYKVAPTERGGQFIAHQDSTVFEPLETADSNDEAVVENILPDPEEPMDRKKLPRAAENSLVKKPSLNLDVKLAEKQPEIITPKQTQENAVEEPPVEEAPVEVVKPRPVIEDKPKPQEKPKPKPKPKAEPITSPKVVKSGEPAKGLYYIQLGAFRDKISAEQKYHAAVQKHGAIVRDLAVHYHYVDLGAKGIYYRVKVGPMSQGLAQQKCEQIKVVQSEGCFVTK